MIRLRGDVVSPLVLGFACAIACLPIDEREVQLTGSVEDASALGLTPPVEPGEPSGMLGAVPSAACSEATCVDSELVGAAPGPMATALESGSGESLDGGAVGSAVTDICSGCVIAGSCVAAASQNADNACQICDPARDAAAWSANDDAVCDDGLFCTVDDLCRAGVCNGEPRVCDDQVACNGVSTCDEVSDSCSPATNECGLNGFCDVTSDACVSTCAGCLVDGVCIQPGAERPGDPCFTCQPSVSTVAYSPAGGRPCGLGPTECSGQDTCNAQGSCQPNHLPASTGCGSSSSNACNQPDACDGSGNCQQRVSANGATCDDGAFCSVGDRCQGGLCQASGNRDCGANRACNEQADQCQCQGCQVGNTCFFDGDVDPTNACQVCDVDRSRTAFSPNVGGRCGSAATECSGQDTCNAQGNCQPNHLPANTGCGSSSSNACNQPDACDGSGNCQQRVSANGAACDDGAFCSVGDRCQAGLCQATGNRDCGSNRSCNEQADQCQCQGCQVGNTCFFDGDVDPTNACQVCDVDRSRTAFSPNVGSRCGSAATDCSAQDTCDNRGRCVANDGQDGTICSGQSGYCSTGQCLSRQQFGTECTLANQCLTGFCRNWFLDVDDDGHGGNQQRRMCSPNPAQDVTRSDGAGLIIPILTVNGQEFVSLGDDCCDSTGFGGNLVFPGKVSPVSIEQTACPNRPERDFDCDGQETCFEGTPLFCL